MRKFIRSLCNCHIHDFKRLRCSTSVTCFADSMIHHLQFTEWNRLFIICCDVDVIYTHFIQYVTLVQSSPFHQKAVIVRKRLMLIWNALVFNVKRKIMIKQEPFSSICCRKCWPKREPLKKTASFRADIHRQFIGTFSGARLDVVLILLED